MDVRSRISCDRGACVQHAKCPAGVSHVVLRICKRWVRCPVIWKLRSAASRDCSPDRFKARLARLPLHVRHLGQHRAYLAPVWQARAHCEDTQRCAQYASTPRVACQINVLRRTKQQIGSGFASRTTDFRITVSGHTQRQPLSCSLPCRLSLIIDRRPHYKRCHQLQTRPLSRPLVWHAFPTWQHKA